MANTENTGLIERLTKKALDGNAVSMSDVVEVAKLLDTNSKATVSAINRLDKRIDELQQSKEEVANDTGFEQRVAIFLGLPTVIKVN